MIVIGGGPGGYLAAERAAHAGLKTLLFEKNSLGVHLIGAYAGEMIWGGAQMLETQFRVTDGRQIIFPHPTVSEIIREVPWEFPDK